MPSADEIRDVQRVTWAGLSAGWEKWDSVIMEQLGPVGAAIIEGPRLRFELPAPSHLGGLCVRRLEGDVCA